jgi:hypothetical protein
VKELRALTPEEFERAAEKLRNPAPGSRIEAAQKYGIDLTLLIEQFRLTPDQRVRKLEAATKSLEKIRGIARRRA